MQGSLRAELPCARSEAGERARFDSRRLHLTGLEPHLS